MSEDHCEKCAAKTRRERIYMPVLVFAVWISAWFPHHMPYAVLIGTLGLASAAMVLAFVVGEGWLREPAWWVRAMDGETSTLSVLVGVSALLLPLVLGLATCQPSPAPTRPPVDGPVDGAAIVPSPDASACERACAVWHNLGCHPEGDPTPHGKSCVDVCARHEDAGYASLHPDCVAKAASCAEARACAK